MNLISASADSLLANPLELIAFFAASAAIIALLVHALWRSMRRNETLKYEFITIIAHKFRTPLTHVKWSVGELIPAEADPYKKQSLEDIRRSNEKLIQLTGTLIDLTDSDDRTKASYAFERVPLCEFVRSVAEPFKDLFHEKNIFFSVQCADPDAAARMDRSRMEYVLQAILENARIYTPPGKNVDVMVGRRGRKAVISVADHGIGMDKADIPRIFGKFFRAHNAQITDTEGLGVGLYLAQSVVRRHGGAIGAYSGGLGQGSTFEVVLPAAKNR